MMGSFSRFNYTDKTQAAFWGSAFSIFLARLGFPVTRMAPGKKGGGFWEQPLMRRGRTLGRMKTAPWTMVRDRDRGCSRYRDVQS